MRSLGWSRAISACVVVALAATMSLSIAAGAAEEDALSYSIKEARAYAYKASLSKEVIEVVGTLTPCDPAEDPYECDEGRYNHEPNCPPDLAMGRTGKVPKGQPPETEGSTGGAGGTAGGTEPPQSSPVRLNQMIALGALSRFGPVKEAAGFASKQYVDLSGRGEPEAHAESEAFSRNKGPYEERCFPKETAEADGTDYTHVLSRSIKALGTYHLAECFREGCSGFGEPTPGMFGASAEHARSIVDLSEGKDSVVAKLSANVDELSYGSGAFTVDSIETYIEIVSDGTAAGLEWSVMSTASGASLAGQKQTLPQGQVVGGPGFSVGMAAPFVSASKDGTQIRVIAPGLMIATEQQAAFFGGAEIYAGFGEGLDFNFIAKPTEDDPTSFEDTTSDFASDDGSFDAGSSMFDAGSFGGGVAIGPSETSSDPVSAAPATELLVYEQATGRGAVAAIVILGILGWFLLMGRWLQRFTWGQALYRVQPFRTIDWLYRAFVKT